MRFLSILLMREISNSLVFFRYIFSYFSWFLCMWKKITDFRFPARRFFMLDFYAQHKKSIKKCNCGAVSDSARKPGGALCPFDSFRLFFIAFFSKNESNLRAHRRNIVLCQVFFDRGCLRKGYVALTCKIQICKMKKDPKIGIHALTERGRVRGQLDLTHWPETPLPRTSRGGGSRISLL